MSDLKIFQGHDMNGNPINNLPDAVSLQQPATLNQLNGAVAARRWKDPVRAATTANITLSGTQTIDGVALVADDEALVKNQTTASANGIYVVKAGAWVRRTDADSGIELVSATVQVSEGTTQHDTQWTCSTDAPITVGTTSLTFVSTGTGGSYTGSGGVSVTGSVISLDTSVAARKGGVNIGDGTAYSFTITHSFGTTDLIAIVRETAGTKEQVYPKVVFTDTNTATVSFSTVGPAPTTGQYRVSFIG